MNKIKQEIIEKIIFRELHNRYGYSYGDATDNIMKEIKKLNL